MFSTGENVRDSNPIRRNRRPSPTWRHERSTSSAKGHWSRYSTKKDDKVNKISENLEKKFAYFKIGAF